MEDLKIGENTYVYIVDFYLIKITKQKINEIERRGGSYLVNGYAPLFWYLSFEEAKQTCVNQYKFKLKQALELEEPTTIEDD